MIHVGVPLAARVNGLRQHALSLTSSLCQKKSHPILADLATKIAVEIYGRREGRVWDLIHAERLTAHVVTPIVAASYVERGGRVSDLMDMSEKKLCAIVNGVFFHHTISQKAIADGVDYVCGRQSDRDIAYLADNLFSGHCTKEHFTAILSDLHGNALEKQEEKQCFKT